MIDSRQFLKVKLKELFLDLDGVEISYEYRISSNIHIVEVKPNDVYRNSKNYINREMELEDAFMSHYPTEELLFISEDSLTQIKSPDFIYKYKLKYDISHLYTPITFSAVLSQNQLAGENNYALAA